MFDGQMSHYRQPKSVAVGVWGGQDTSLEVTKDGATVEYSCAHGTIRGRILLDRSGRFNVSGVHVREGPGPIREDQVRRGEPVVFKGKVTGQKMVLTVTNKSTNTVIGTFTLTFGQSVRLRKCK
jgi:hypothetical protein